VSDETRTGVLRRDVLRLIGAAPLAGGFALSQAQAATAQERVSRQKGPAYVPKFFTPHEWATVRVLVDMVIPRDARSGSATDAQVPEFMDFVIDDPLADPWSRERNKTQMRGGLAWLDRECARRFAGRRFLEATDAERRSVLDSIAYPKDKDATPERSSSYDDVALPNKSVELAPPEGPAPADAAGTAATSETADEALPLDRLSHGVAFFSAFRDLTASGFWSSEMGVKDIEYIGNTFVAEWKGCPPEVLAKLGLQRS
jgi:gluconate 2-dehydrogenase gamma chain